MNVYLENFGKFGQNILCTPKKFPAPTPIYSLDLAKGGMDEATRFYLQDIETLFCTKSAMSIPRAACGRVDGFVRPRLGLCCSKSIVHTDNLSLF